MDCTILINVLLIISSGRTLQQLNYLWWTFQG